MTEAGEVKNTTLPPWENLTPLEKELFGRSLINSLGRIKGPEGPLFHYTSPEVFEKLLQSATFRLTNAAYLNDQGELTYPIPVARRALFGSQQSLNDAALDGFFAAASADLAGHLIFKPWYVTSFSLKGNLLSQWRAYCPRGGYSIGLDGTAAADAVRKTYGTCQFGPVIYDVTMQSTIITGHIERHVKLWRELRPRYENISQDEFDRKVARNLNLALTEEFTFFKSDAFREEDEWRIVRYRMPVDEVGFFERQGVLTPYLEVSLANSEGRLPLEQVFVSPISDFDLAVHSAELVLEKHGYRRHRSDGNRYVAVPSYRLR
jgi:hypothetical protein